MLSRNWNYKDVLFIKKRFFYNWNTFSKLMLAYLTYVIFLELSQTEFDVIIVHWVKSVQIRIFLQSKFIEMTLRHGCSPVNLLHIFRTPFPKNTSWWLPLVFTTLYIYNWITKKGQKLRFRNSRPKVFWKKVF